MILLPGLLQRGYTREALDWMSRCLRIDSHIHRQAVDELILRGRSAFNWYDATGELVLLGAGSQQAALEGLKGFQKASETTIVGQVAFVPNFGANILEGQVNAFINTNKPPMSWPGFAHDSMFIGVFVTSDLPGAWQEAGAGTNVGLKAVMIRASSGFRGGSWLGSNQVIQGGSQSLGWHAGCRESLNDTYSMDDGTIVIGAIPFESITGVPITILGAEPAAASSPNSVLVFAFGGKLSHAQAEQQFVDLRRYTIDIGTYYKIQVPPFELGANAFLKDSIHQTVPTDLRVYRQTQPPGTDLIDATYPHWPMTDSVARFFTTGTRSADLIDKFQTFSGSKVIRVEHVAHGLKVDDVFTAAGAITFNGIDAERLNVRHRVQTIVDADHFEFELLGEGVASANGMGGGTVQMTYRVFLPVSSTFSGIPGRPGRHSGFQWSHRGDAEIEGGPATGARRPNDIGGAPITLFRDGPPGSGLKAGLQCRPGYRTKRRAAGATVVGVAQLLELPYDAYVTKYDLDPAKIIPWWYAFIHSDELFTQPVEGFATSYDYVVLQNGTMSNVTNYDPSRLGIAIDWEHSDYRSGELVLEMSTDMSDLAVAAGVKICVLGHNISGPQALSNAWTLDNTHQIAALPGFETIMILSQKRGSPEEAKTYLDEQVNQMRGPDGTVPPRLDKVMLSCTLGVGNSRVPLDQCAAIRDWRLENNIKHVHIRPAASRIGGIIQHVWNQQLVTYLPELGQEPEMTGLAQIGAWANIVRSNGGTVSLEREARLIALIQELIDEGLYEGIKQFTLFAGENEISVRADLRHRKLGAFGTGDAKPLITVDRAVQFDGVNDFFDHRWAPSEAPELLPTPALLVYVLDEITTGGAYAVGAVNGGAQGLRLNPLQSKSATVSVVQGQALTDNSTVSDPTHFPLSGLFCVDTVGGLHRFSVNGELIGTRTPVLTSVLLPTRNMITGAFNNNGAPSGFKAGKRLATITMAGTTLDKYATLKGILETYFTDIGAITL
jgi:hypothetical protein